MATGLHARMRLSRRWIWRIVAALVVVGLLIGLGRFLIRDYDPTRVLYKQLTAPDEYTYDEVDPRFLSTDPATLINPDLVRDPEVMRQRLIDLVWGKDGFPTDLMPKVAGRNVNEPALGDLGDGVRVDRLLLEQDFGLWPVFFYLHAPRPIDRLVLYYHGFGDPISHSAPLFRALLAAGYDVIAFNSIGYGGMSSIHLRVDPHFRTDQNFISQMDLFDRPLRIHIDQVIAAINYALASRPYRSVDMIGLSMGGFMTILTSAVDTRIERSYPVAGDLPIYLRMGQEVLPGYPPYYQPLLDLVSHPDLYVLAASGSGRGQMQIFNRYDRCCYNGVRSTVYEDAVRKAVAATPDGGWFKVVLDETHADHKISDYAIEKVLSDLARDR